MISRHEYRGGVWIDLEQPTEEEIREIANEFSISKIIEREIISPTPSPIVITDSAATLFVLLFPAHGAENGETKSQEVDFIVSERFIVTVRYEIIAPLYHLKKLLETQDFVNGHDALTTDTLLEILFAHLYTAVRDHIDHVADNLTRVEKDMFDGHERQTVRLISSISREFLHAEAALANHEESLRHFLEVLTNRGFFGPAFAERAERILADRAQIARLVSTHRAIATETRETNNALLSAKQNEVIKILTVISFIFLPLALIAKVFAMKVAGMPFADDPNAFWIIVGFMFAIALLLTVYVMKKRWI